jgi:dihydrofolate reductase
VSPALVLVAALARNGVIGRGQKLPWHLPEDLQHFRRVTAGHAVIMGRRTWDSLPARFRPLPGRRNLVLTRQAGWRADGAETVPSLAQALTLLPADARAFVIGGAEVYAAALPLASELLLTEIDQDFEGDACFPPFDRLRYVESARETHRAAPPNDFGYAFVRYVVRLRPLPA